MTLAALYTLLYALLAQLAALQATQAHSAQITAAPIAIVQTIPSPTAPTYIPPAKSQAASAATAVASIPVPTGTSPASSFSPLELDVIADINAARSQNGLKPLAADATLGNLARAHSADMLANNYFDHTSPSGCSAMCRYQNAGYSYWAMAENIYWMEGFNLSTSDSAQKVVDSWQNSPGHRENDLGSYTNVGVGIAQSGSKVYVTADFSTPR